MQKFTGISFDSRLVKEGGLFVAVKGGTNDGHDYIDEAVKRGAAAIIGEKGRSELNIPKSVEYIKVKDSKEALGQYASEFFGNPSRKLKVIGVTGTKGKTTTVHLIHHILTECGRKVGLISSITSPGFHVTSPDVITLHKLLSEMVDKGFEYAAVEVSSHGIDQKRIAGVDFDIAVLTNIAPEHLDYHKTFDEYKRVKMSFVNSAKRKVITPVKTNLNILPGEFNNINAETAVSVAGLLGIDRKKALRALKSFKLPVGRMEEVKNNLGVRIFIDFAHTPDSLEKSLMYLRSITKGKLISVFGCAGERDPGKRSEMGKISSQIADLSVFTAEDPRSEDIFTILNSMERYAKNFVSIPERSEAIAFAISKAKPGDTIGFFGKGHERSMAYKWFEHPWSDQETISNYLERDTDVSAIVLAGGKGSRMHSEIPKVLHEICGRPMIAYSLQNLRNSKVGEVVTVLSHKKNLIEGQIQGAVKVAVQKNPKGGTADAAAAGLRKVSEEAKTVMVLYGDDTAFYTAKTIIGVLNNHKKSNSKLTFVTLLKQDPRGLGRIIRDKSGDLVAIIEEKDANKEQRKIKEVNDGLYVFDKGWLSKNLSKVKKNKITGELYMNELIDLAIAQAEKVSVYRLPDDDEWQGVNTPEELAKAKKKMEERLR